MLLHCLKTVLAAAVMILPAHKITLPLYIDLEKNMPTVETVNFNPDLQKTYFLFT